MTQWHRVVRYLATAFILFFLVSFCDASQINKIASSTDTLKKAVWAWADKSGGEHAVFISRRAGNSWEKPTKISENEGVNVVPALTTTADGDLFVIWSDFEGNDGAQLHYRRQKNGVWTGEQEFYTGLESNTAPAVAVDGGGRLWAVWAGFNGVSDEIYYSMWNDTSFETPQALTNNDIPDILPVLGIDESTGTPWIQWQQFSESGYVKFEATWNGSIWTAPLPVATTEAADTAEQTSLSERTLMLKKAYNPKNIGTGEAVKQGQKADEDMEIEIPGFIQNPESASIHIPGYAIQSLPVRSVAPGK